MNKLNNYMNQKIRLLLFPIFIMEEYILPTFTLIYQPIPLRKLRIFKIAIFLVHCKNIGGKLACMIIRLQSAKFTKTPLFFG